MQPLPAFGFYEPFAPGDTLEERLATLKAAGFEYAEINASDLRDDLGASARVALQRTGMKAAAICGGLRGSLLSDESKVRQMALDDIKRMFQAGAAIGAPGVIVVPVLGASRLPDLSPWMDREALHTAVLIHLLKELAPEAEATGCRLWLEPLNKYRTHYMTLTEQAVRVCDAVGSSHIQLMVDTFHIALEEERPEEAIMGAADHLAHVHLVDTSRRLPGRGSFHFEPVIRALKRLGYNGVLSFEAPVTGPFHEEVARAKHFVTSLWESVTVQGGSPTSRIDDMLGDAVKTFRTTAEESVVGTPGSDWDAARESVLRRLGDPSLNPAVLHHEMTPIGRELMNLIDRVEGANDVAALREVLRDMLVTLWPASERE